MRYAIGLLLIACTLLTGCATVQPPVYWLENRATVHGKDGIPRIVDYGLINGGEMKFRLRIAPGYTITEDKPKEVKPKSAP